MSEDPKRALRIAQRMEELLVGRSHPGRQQQLKELVRGLVEELQGQHAVPVVRARAVYGQRTAYIVDYCPYCHKSHRHSPGGDSMQRMADCLRGEYVLEVSDE